MNAPVNLAVLLPAWEAFRQQTGIAPIHDEAHYQHMTDVLNALLETAAGQEDHPVMGLVDIVGDLIEDYEAEHHPLPETTGIQALRFLLEQHDLNASDLGEIASPDEVSQILAGQRPLYPHQAQWLAQRFQVSPDTFI